MSDPECQPDMPVGNQDKSFYLYIGADSDDGWEIAKTACVISESTIPLRVDGFSAINEAFLPKGNYSAVAFDRDGLPKHFLSKDEAANLIVVLDKIAGTTSLQASAKR